MDSFNSFFKQFNDGIVQPPKGRIQKGFTGLNRKTGQNLVPEYTKHDRSKIDEVERLKGKKNQWVKIPPHRVSDIIKFYKIYDFDHDHPKILGRTNVQLVFDFNTQEYYLRT